MTLKHFLHHWPSVRGSLRWPVDSPNTGPVMRNAFPYDDASIYISGSCTWFALCCVLLFCDTCQLYPYPSGSLQWHCITMTSQWVQWRFKSPVSRLFAHSLVQADIKENIKASRHWPLWGESRVDSSRKGPVTRKMMFPFDDAMVTTWQILSKSCAYLLNIRYASRLEGTTYH